MYLLKMWQEGNCGCCASSRTQNLPEDVSTRSLGSSRLLTAVLLNSPPECPVELEIVTSLLMDSHTLLLIVVVVVVVVITIKSPRQSAYTEI
jgi:hypothetical protein